MIKRIKVENFQGIGSIDVEVGPVTVFYGESDTGKSALVRALYGLAFNSYPKGHVRDGHDQSLVEIEVESGVVTATKGKSNAYEFDGQTWERVGTEVPEEVTKALGWREIELDDGSRFTPNFGLQFDSPFLVTESPSRKAKLLGSLTNIATLFAATKEATSRERKASQVVTAWSETRDATVGEIETAEAEWRLVDGKAQTLRNLWEIVETEDNQVRAYEQLLAVAKQRTAEVREAQAEYAKTKVIELPDVEADLVRLRELVFLENEARVMGEELKAAREYVEANRLLARMAEQMLEEFQKENKVCPVCGNEWHGD